MSRDVQPKPTKALSLEAAVFFRDQLRKARARALADSEDFHTLVTTIERIGGVLSEKPPSGLAQCAEPLLSFIRSRIGTTFSDAPDGGVSAQGQFEMLRRARNEAMHEGASARHLTEYAVRFALLMEDALMSDVDEVRHYMVREPVCAAEWQPLQFVKQSMLSNSFSFLPVCCEGEWRLISDYALARTLACKSKLRETLRMSVAMAVKEQKLELEPAKIVGPEDKIASLLATADGKPWIVLTKGPELRMVGILTPFDLI